MPILSETRVTKETGVLSQLHAHTVRLNQNPGFWANLWIASLASLALSASPALAQLTPDPTLGAEASQVNEGAIVRGAPANRIEGGATRGVNLFHSFREFNVGDLQRVYFANPAGIDAILSRVTGANPSRILGTLGVEGNASLFFLNPNGILFGPNVRLDVAGSFVGSTATSFKLPDGSEFSATHPQAPPLLTVKLTPGLQLGTAAPGSTISNQGLLTTGEDLVLVGNRLELRGQLQAGGNLTLQAGDTVQIRDSATDAFVATSGKDLTIQGDRAVDILTLSNSQTRIESGGDLNLISNGTISGDAHFFSGGNLSMLTLTGAPGNFVSLYDPIIYANGDVSFGNYSGAALKVEATGSIQGGDITILTPDSGIPNTDPDFAILTGSKAVILRSGVASVPIANLLQNAGSTSFVQTLGLTPGITVGNIDTSDVNGGDGGDVILTATNGSITTGNITASSTSPFVFFGNGGDAGNGGDIALTASGNITAKKISSSSTASSLSGDSGNARSGGAIALTSTRGSIATGGIDSYSTSAVAFGFGNAGNTIHGGTIILTAFDGIATGGLLSYSLSSSDIGNAGTVGNGGAIILTTANGNVNTGNLNSDSSSGSVSLSGSSGNAGNTGNGGTISITNFNGDITTGNLSSSSFSSSLALSGNTIGGITGDVGNAGNGGNITLTATNGDIKSGGVSSTSFSISESFNGGTVGNAGNGGNVTLTTNNGSIAVNFITSYSYSSPYFGSTTNIGNSGNGGSIKLASTNGNITVNRNLYSFSYSPSGNSGNGGTITLLAQNGEIVGTANSSSVIGSFAISDQKTAGIGGNITLEAKNQVANLELLTLSSSTNAGDIQLTGFGNLAVENSRLLSSKQVTVNIPGAGAIIIDLGGKGQSGDVMVTSLGNLTLKNSSIQSDTKGSDPAGNVTITSPGLITFDDSQIISNTSSTGQAGSISVMAGEGIDITGATSGLFAQTTSAGTAGNISLSAPQITLQRDAQISTTATATATNRDGGGSITLNASDIFLAGTVGVFAETQGQTPAGTLTLRPYDNQQSLNLILAASSRVSASTSGSGNGGDIRLTAPEAITIAGSGKVAVETTGSGNAGNITITTPLLTLRDGVELSASTRSSGKAGNLTVTGDRLDLSTGARISTNTSSSGAAGNITLNLTDQLRLTGSGTGLFASTTAGSTGDGGNITIDPRRVVIRDGAGIFVDSQGSGIGGNITVDAGRMELRDRGVISAETASSQGGNITLNVQDVLLLRNGSQISTTAGTAQAGGNGGNITINAPRGFVIGVLTENSDITANAFTGSGGRIEITAQGIYGLQFQPKLTPRSDITASSTFGLSGTVSLNILGIDPTRSLFLLPANPLDPRMQLDDRCKFGGRFSRSSFIYTGRGGFPTDPADILRDEESQLQDTDWIEWGEKAEGGRQKAEGENTGVRSQELGVRREGAGGRKQGAEAGARGKDSTSSRPPHPLTHPPTLPSPILEATGWIQTPDGRVFLVADAPNGGLQGPWLPMLDCIIRRQSQAPHGVTASGYEPPTPNSAAIER